MYVQTYTNLNVTSLTPEWHERTCDYWYTVTTGATAHTAFNKRESLQRWMDERGLSLTKPLPDRRGEFSYQRIQGTYRTCSHMDEGAFQKLENVVVITRTLCNGDYTLAKITLDPDGIRTVHTLNPNVHTRKVFNYWASRKQYG